MMITSAKCRPRNGAGRARLTISTYQRPRRLFATHPTGPKAPCEQVKGGTRMTQHLPLILMAFATTVAAQRLNYPAPGIPRLPDGKPNLAAPAPKAADGK